MPHALCAIGHRLVESGRSVIFAPAYRLVQDLPAAKRDFGPAASTTQAPAVAPTAVPTQPDEGGTPGWLIALLVIIIGGALLAIVIALIVRNRSR